MENDMKKNEWYSIREAAKYLEIGEPTLYRWMRDRKITYRKIGDSTRFLQSDLDAVVEVFHSERDSGQIRQICPVCHGSELLRGRLRSTGLIYFQLEKSKFWTFTDNNIKTDGMICKRCGAVTLFGDLKKLEKLEPAEEKKTDAE